MWWRITERAAAESCSNVSRPLLQPVTVNNTQSPVSTDWCETLVKINFVRDIFCRKEAIMTASVTVSASDPGLGSHCTTALSLIPTVHV